LNRPSGMPPLQVITNALPNRISRPAVSRHLRLLKEAGLVTDRAEGTRRLYRLDDAGIAAVREYLEHVWGEAAARFRLLAENTGEQTERGDR
jgi:DNA-binding transcriptional ArsR family regulator